MNRHSKSPDGTSRSRPMQVAQRIKEWIVAHDLGQGDRLPSEAEMIATFAVSKGTVREAMRTLEGQGLIVTRTGPGGGSFVEKVSDVRASQLLANYFFFDELSVADIYQLRRLLEPELAAGLAGQLSDAQLDALHALAMTYDAPAATAEEEMQQHVVSLRFHAKLAEYADNRLLGFVIGFMARVLTDLTVFHKLYAPPNHDLWEKGHRFQLDLVAALRRGDAVAARAISLEHMQTAEAAMNAQEARVRRGFI